MSALINVTKTGAVSVQRDGSDMQVIMALNDAILILDTAKTETCRMALPIFAKVAHAHEYLCKQLKELL